MNCPKCDGRCKCIDSRSALTYGLGENDDMLEQDPVKERKYVCRECEKVYITQEYIATSYLSKSKDKRLQPSK
jgi:hypothetical protein